LRQDSPSFPTRRSSDLLLRYTVADAKDFHLDGETLGDTNDGVVDERARQAVQCTVLTVVIRTDNANFVVLNFRGDWSWDLNVKGALWALNLNILTVDLGFYAIRQSDGCLTNS